MSPTSPDRATGRVVRVDRGEVDVVLDGPPDVAGDQMRATTTTAAKDCVVGDEVTVERAEARVVHIEPRRTAFVRRAARGALAPQTLAANMDVVVLCHGLVPGVHPRRLERELVLAYDSGATPMVVLTKADLVGPEQIEEGLEQVHAVAPGVEVLTVSNPTGDGIDELRAALPPGRVFALLGASGVGKSSIVNSLAGRPVQLVGEIRDGDGKGRHTTTAAQLIRLPDDRLLLDTPGVRALALWQAWDGLAAAFPEIDAAASGCRFGDCSHGGEPGCAVADLVAEGEIDAERFESWCRLRDEMVELDTELEEQQRRRSRTGRPEGR